ncbi:hypothetical protein LCGC14_1866100 [marine sediment metagenome]|uniref:ABM domain-containing protein n=1 Tax=marine sediment metagenome TaxID=412755 RepID=A0A0F9J529_9ZZZZ|nr:hypothetical protein [archaeon]HEC37121.1 hypothetical protein [bacterium]
MPYIIVQTWHPTDIVTEVTEKYIEVMKEFPFDRSLGKETISIAANTNKKGVEAMSVMEVKQGKLEEAWAWAGRRLAPFHSIKGFEYEIRLWSTVAEALEGSEYSLPE